MAAAEELTPEERDGIRAEQMRLLGWNPDTIGLLDYDKSWANGHAFEDAIEEAPKAQRIDWPKLSGEPPARTWWIQDWLGPWPTLTAGAGGAGKSRLWQAIGTSLACAKPYLGQVSAPLKVLIWGCEDDHDEVWRSQMAINSHLRLTMADLGGLHIVPRLGFANTIMDLEFGQPRLTPLFDELKQQINDLKIDLLVLDNIAQVFGGNINDIHQATVFVNAIAGIVRDRPFCPVFLGHVSRSQGSEFSGSAAWENAVRMRWYLGSTLPDQKLEEEETVDPDVVYLARRKANYAAKDWLKLRFVNGMLIPDEPENLNSRFGMGHRNDVTDRLVLDAFNKLHAIGIKTTDGKTSGDYLPSQIVSKGWSEGNSKRDLVAAMNRLMGCGRLKRDVIGQYPNRSPKYGLVTG